MASNRKIKERQEAQKLKGGRWTQRFQKHMRGAFPNGEERRPHYVGSGQEITRRTQ